MCLFSRSKISYCFFFHGSFIVFIVLFSNQKGVFCLGIIKDIFELLLCLSNFFTHIETNP